jgi:transposase
MIKKKKKLIQTLDIHINNNNEDVEDIIDKHIFSIKELESQLNQLQSLLNDNFTLKNYQNYLDLFSYYSTNLEIIQEDVNFLINQHKQQTYQRWVDKQQTFSNLPINELTNLSSQLWFPTKISEISDVIKNGTLSKIDSESWFKINLISKDEPDNIFCKPCNIFNKYNSQKNKLLSTVLNNENDENIIQQITSTQKEIDDSPEKFNPLKKKFKKSKNKLTKFDPNKQGCTFVETTTFNEIKYGKYCNQICTNNLNICKNHTNKTILQYDMLSENLCQHIITQKSGGKNGNEIVDRKGMICGEFTFNSKNEKYCLIHSKRHKDQELENKKTVERTFQVRVYPNIQQQNKLEEFFGSKRKTYNLCVENKIGDTLNETECKKKIVTDIKNDENLDFLINTPEDIRTFAVKEYYTNYNNANEMYIKKQENEKYKRDNYLNYKHVDIKKPKLTFQEKKDSQSINIEKKLVKTKENEIYVYPRIFKNDSLKIRNRQLKHDKKLKKILEGTLNHDIKIIKTITNKYYICFMTDNEVVETKKQTKIVAIDTNIRNLGTSYSEDKSYEFGADIYETIIPMINKREKLKKEYKKNIKKIINGRIEQKEFERSKMEYRKQEEKIKNSIDDLHYKVINKLMNEGYTLILIPKLNIRKMLESSETPKIIKKIAQIERHMTFIKRLKEKAELRGIRIKIINENMTTQICGKCFSKYKFSGEIYNCINCKSIIGRDINSARNIYMKEIGKTIEITKYLHTI